MPETFGVLDDLVQHGKLRHYGVSVEKVEEPLYLLGIMYVLEGSTLGGAILKELVIKNFNLTDNIGVLFLDHYKKQKKQYWEEFKERINALDVKDTERIGILQTAVDFFQKIESIFKHLYPVSKSIPFYNVTTLNPEAGRHSIPEDIMEIQAALRAGVKTWEQFPYYAWRYGLRGKQFTRSDSVWLVTLCDLQEKLVLDQINWLGKVLSSRGMPQLLLATHLVNLVEELEKANPDKINQYKKLIVAANALKEKYDQAIRVNQRQELIGEFERSIGQEWSHRLKNMGEIIVAAVVDEKIGIENALPCVRSWATDENRFPKIWIDSVLQLIVSAKKASA